MEPHLLSYWLRPPLLPAVWSAVLYKKSDNRNKDNVGRLNKLPNLQYLILYRSGKVVHAQEQFDAIKKH
jgi:hypothetical protein